jgi:hypothetical protein
MLIGLDLDVDPGLVEAADIHVGGAGLAGEVRRSPHGAAEIDQTLGWILSRREA